MKSVTAEEVEAFLEKNEGVVCVEVVSPFFKLDLVWDEYRVKDNRENISVSGRKGFDAVQELTIQKSEQTQFFMDDEDMSMKIHCSSIEIIFNFF